MHASAPNASASYVRESVALTSVGPDGELIPLVPCQTKDPHTAFVEFFDAVQLALNGTRPLERGDDREHAPLDAPFDFGSRGDDLIRTLRLRDIGK